MKKYILIIISDSLSSVFSNYSDVGLLDLLILSHFSGLYFMFYFLANVFNFIFDPFLIFVVLVSVIIFLISKATSVH